jgi:hypothetical protein
MIATKSLLTASWKEVRALLIALAVVLALATVLVPAEATAGTGCTHRAASVHYHWLDQWNVHFVKHFWENPRHRHYHQYIVTIVPFGPGANPYTYVDYTRCAGED